ncbi:Concanavalin A-like lectin/glucanase subgroup [Penicillium cf. griseofulvum]|uniref:Concanavalin A-like lectin/glucanase subgroup n=1 Tax=Penicillium cf. griseofulvum TaxID=2972120 RepID=A0A9W9T253_9EURO|nr:Concanavalin A-like lectin/glucanase subgroup [Penicillium cf. griseofulvum]KAJ5440466.1 Concanavalin A-like lectin/glucanase subgroup [Penicillium cf. griseofulvum]KAJ5448513.1 Concanavalin A-like lectin/glucanase subgroup [Penicillium cf. griseofulvum]
MSQDTQIIGYAQPWIVSPGDPVDIKISSTEKGYDHRLVRLVQGFSGPHAPPVVIEDITEVPIGHHEDGCFQDACAGSYALIPSWADVALAAGEGFEVEFHAQPYLLDVDYYCQTLISSLDLSSRTGFAIVLKNSKLEFYIGTGDKIQVVQSQLLVNRWRWLKISLSIVNNTLTSSIHQLNRLAETAPNGEKMTTALSAPLILGSNSLMFGAGMFKDINEQSSKPACYYNGRIDSPSFTVTSASRRTVAEYDFSKDISSDSIVDVSGNGRHGVLINAPTRAVKGYNWDGTQPDWTKASYGYGAIHFHEDDLDDAKWSTNFTITIPSTARSGAYAVEVKTADGTSDMITFFVRPNPSSTAKVALVMTTFTYLAYANERMYDESKSSAMTTPDGVSIGRGNEYYKNLARRPDLGLSAYDVHTDGSPNAYSSALRPILNLRPGYVHWALDRPREFSADLLMVGYLERSGIPYDIITDHCLSSRGQEATAQYTTLITGCHPEYHTLTSLDAFSAFAKSGGNLMYLGGNGFYWVADVLNDRSHRMEVRKGDQGCRSVTFPAGERMHSLTGTLGGLWRSRGRAPNYLWGIGPCAFGTGPGKPYTADLKYAQDEKYSWIFKGIDPTQPIGAKGFGGGASGDEIDRLDFALGTPSNAVLLGRSQQHDDSFGLFNEDSMFPMVNTLGSTCDMVRSDLVYYDASGDGAVFSVGSINWYCSMGWDDYNNDVATMTDNVLREFVKRGKGAGEK